MFKTAQLLPALLPLALAACADEGFGRVSAISATLPVPAPTPVATGSLYRAGSFVGLASDRRARRVGDLITIKLVENTIASKSASADSAREGNTQASLPQIPPFTLIPDAATRGGSSQSFKGSGAAAQSNRLLGDLTVTVAEVLPGGLLRVAGEKRLVLNRGEEQLQLTGLVRVDDLGFDNSVSSTRVADAHIRFSGTGQVADGSRQGWLARLFAKVFPL